MGVVLAVVVAVLGYLSTTVIAHEYNAWAGWLAEQLIKQAACDTPGLSRSDCRAWWLGELDDHRQRHQVAGLIFALSFLGAGARMRLEAIRPSAIRQELRWRYRIAVIGSISSVAMFTLSLVIPTSTPLGPPWMTTLLLLTFVAQFPMELRSVAWKNQHWDAYLAFYARIARSRQAAGQRRQ